MLGSDRYTLLEVREWLGGPPSCPEVVGRHFLMSESSWQALQEVREWSGGPPGCPGVVLRSSRMSWSGREALPDV